MRAVFPLTPNEDLKAGQYWFARRTADAEVAPAQAEDFASCPDCFSDTIRLRLSPLGVCRPFLRCHAVLYI